MNRSILSFLPVVLLVIGAWPAAWLATQAAGPPRCVVGAEDDLGCARGFETRERDGTRPFRWTDEQASVVLTGLGYGPAGAVELTLAAPRPPGDAPSVVLSASGHAVGFSAGPAARRYRLLLPGGFPAGDRAEISVASATFMPEGGARSLGAMVYEARALPLGPRAPGPLLVLALLGLGLAACVAAGWASTTATDKVQSVMISPWIGPHWLPPLAGLITIAAAAALWSRLPVRVAPFLPALALLAGGAALAARRTGGFALLMRPPVLAAILASAALDGAIVGGALRGPWITLAVGAQAALTVWAVWSERRRGGISEDGGWRMEDGALPSSILHPPSSFLLVALAVRLLAFAARLLAARGANDPDVELFYSYGRATLELGTPVVEYPSGALLPWALMALPASRELFALLLPLLNLACDLAIVWGIWTLGERRTESVVSGQLSVAESHGQRTTDNGQFALFYALSPLLLPFWHGKYDPLPAALLVVGLAAFARGRPGWAGAALGLGGAVKWVPWLAAPFLAWELLRPARWGALARFCGALAGVVIAVSLPFALRDPQTFLVPYTLQGGRQIVGESIWFPLALLLDPGLIKRLAAPWEGVAGAPIGAGATVAAQALALGVLALAQLARASELRRTLALAAMAPAVFLLLNRVFSPQYLLVISACTLSAGAVLLRGRAAWALIAALALMQAANLMIWPNTAGSWLLASIMMFTLGVGVVIGLAILAVRRTTAGGLNEEAAEGAEGPEGRVEQIAVPDR